MMKLVMIIKFTSVQVTISEINIIIAVIMIMKIYEKNNKIKSNIFALPFLYLKKEIEITLLIYGS